MSVLKHPPCDNNYMVTWPPVKCAHQYTRYKQGAECLEWDRNHPACRCI